MVDSNTYTLSSHSICTTTKKETTPLPMDWLRTLVRITTLPPEITSISCIHSISTIPFSRVDRTNDSELASSWMVRRKERHSNRNSYTTMLPLRKCHRGDKRRTQLPWPNFNVNRGNMLVCHRSMLQLFNFQVPMGSYLYWLHRIEWVFLPKNVVLYCLCGMDCACLNDVFNIVDLTHQFHIQIIPALRKYAAERGEKGNVPVVISTCSPRQYMCTHYAVRSCLSPVSLSPNCGWRVYLVYWNWNMLY